MLDSQQQVTLSRHLKDYLVGVSKEYLPPDTDIEIDGLVCLAKTTDSAQKVVLKVHHIVNSSGNSSTSPHNVPVLPTWTNDLPQDLSISSKSQHRQCPKSAEQHQLPFVTVNSHYQLATPADRIISAKQSSDNQSTGDPISRAKDNATLLCKICEENVFGGFQALEEHVKFIHKRYVCETCLQTFSMRCNLRRHEQLHKGLKPFACDQCDKTFSRSSDLRMHKRKHTDSLLSSSVEPQPSQVDYTHTSLQNSNCQDEMSYKADCNTQENKEMSDEEEEVNDDQVMRGEYQKSSDEGEPMKDDSSSNDAAAEIKLQNSNQDLDSSLQMPARKRRKGNPVKFVGNNESDEVAGSYVPSFSYVPVETVNPSRPASPDHVEGENDPLLNSYNSDVLSSFTEQQPQEHLPSQHLQSLQSLTRSPLVIKPDNNMFSPLSVTPSSSSACAQAASPRSTPPQTTDDGDDDKDYTCSYNSCLQVFHGFQAFENHFVSVHSRYPCKLCKQTFSGKNNRTRHIKNHNRAKIYPCPDCGKYFSRPDSMREHRFIHTISYQEDKCRRCNMEFTRKSLLLAHLKTCFRSSRSKNGCIDETPYMQNAGGAAAGTNESTDNALKLPAPDTTVPFLPIVKNENNNDTVLPQPLDINAIIKNASVFAVSPMMESIIEKSQNVKYPSNKMEALMEKPLDLKDNCLDKPLDLKNSIEDDKTLEEDCSASPKQAEKISVEDKVTSQAPSVETIANNNEHDEDEMCCE